MADLVGIARLAAQSPRIEAKRTVEFFELPTRSFISRCDSPRVPFQWMINPYRGCEFGCKYCYARYTHEFMELRDGADFEHKIFVKHFDAAGFRKELDRIPPDESIAMGTATDPYQPAERRYLRSRAILGVFAATSGHRLWITTKSDLVARDLDLLQEVARRHYLNVSVTVTTMDCEMARLLEPLAPRPDLRIGAVGKLTAGGIRTSVYCSPVLPLINDSEASLNAIAQAAAAAGAYAFGANVLFLKPCAKSVFFPFLEERFPALVRRYRERFDRNAYLTGDYPEKIRDRVQEIRRRHGLEKGRASAQKEPELWPSDPQMTLFV